MNTGTVTNAAPLEAEHEALRAGLLEAHQPQNAHERVLVEEFIDATWDLKAARRVDREFWFYVGGHYGAGPSGIAQAQFQEKEGRFRTHLRDRASCERSYYRALAALKALGRNLPRTLIANGRPSAADPPQSPAPEPPSAPPSPEPLLPHPETANHSGRRSQVRPLEPVDHSILGLQYRWIAVLAWIALQLQRLAPAPAVAVVKNPRNVAVAELPRRNSGARVIPFRRPVLVPRASLVPRLRDPALRPRLAVVAA